MGTMKDTSDDTELRQRAEKALEIGAGGTEPYLEMSPEKMKELIHELQVHQIELEMQNHELRRIQDALEKTRDRYSHLYDFAPIGYFTVNQTGIIHEANLTIALMLGIERSALMGKPFTRFVLRDDQDIFYKHRQRLLETEAPQSCELRLVKKDGHPFYARLECTMITKMGDDLKQIRAAVSDISDQRMAEEALRKSERLLNETQMLSKIGGWEYDVGKRSATWTDQVYRIYGLNREIFDPSDMKESVSFYAPEDRKKIEQAFANACNEGRSYDLESRFMPAKGEKRWVRTIGNPVLENRKVTKIMGSIIDITEPKKLREKVRQSQKMEAIGTLTGGIAHDYNNLLAIIMGNLSMAREETKPHSNVAEFLHGIEQASRKAGDLTHQLMTLSRGGYPIKKLRSVERLLKEIPGQFHAHHGIEYTFSIEGDLWPAEYDSKQMRCAITNVLVNAAEAMPRGGTITLQAENQILDKNGKDSALPLNKGKYVRISVKDEGRGIPEESLRKIFDPYFSTKDRGAQKGMGLSLTVTHAVVEKHGGHIMVDSEIGVGTTVTIYLPASEDKGEDQGATHERDDTALSISSDERTIKRILVMDDEEMLRNLAQKMLEQLGCEVETAGDGFEAILKYKKRMASGEPFDGVILDLTVKGGMGGTQTIKELIKIDPNVKAMVCSGYNNDPAMADFKEYGFREAMAKPYQMEDLERALKKVLS